MSSLEIKAARSREWRRNHPGYTTKYSSAWAKDHPEKDRESKRKYSLSHPEQNLASYPRKMNYHLKQYRLNIEQYNSMLEAQGHACLGCGNIPGQGEPRLCVDHNAKTGKVRELLCRRCNLILGNAMENPEVLRKLALYLDKHTEE